MSRKGPLLGVCRLSAFGVVQFGQERPGVVESGRCAAVRFTAQSAVLKALRMASLAAAVALAALMLLEGDPRQPEWWVISPLVFAFALSPLCVAYFTAAKTSHRELRASMALLSGGYIVFAALTFYSVFRDPDATSGLAFMAVPAFGWMGLPLAALAAALMIGFRPRSGQT